MTSDALARAARAIEAAIDAGWLYPEQADELRAELFAASWARMVLLACVLASPDAPRVAFETLRAAMALSRICVEETP